MKKAVAVLLSFSMLMGATPVFAMTENYITRVETVAEETSFAMDKAPQLVFRYSEDHSGTFSFLLNLEKAKWNYGESGTISEGVTYEKVTDTILKVTVNTDLASATTANLRIPIYATLTESGSATITVDPMESMVSSGSYVFAHAGTENGTITVDVEAADTIGSTGTIPSVTITDNSALILSKGEVIRLKLTNGFRFVEIGDMVTTGKFMGNVSVAIRQTAPSTIEITMDKSTSASTGKLVLANLKIKAGEDSEYGKVELVVTKDGGSGTVILGSHGKVEVTEQVPNKDTVKFTVGSSYYVKNGEESVKMDAAPFVDSNGRTMLPLRALANAVDVPDTDIAWNDATKTVTLTKGDMKVSVTIGSNLIYVNGVARTMDTTAVVSGERTYLPLRAVCNALGFADEAIVWDEVSQSVTLTK